MLLLVYGSSSFTLPVPDVLPFCCTRLALWLFIVLDRRHSHFLTFGFALSSSYSSCGSRLSALYGAPFVHPAFLRYLRTTHVRRPSGSLSPTIPDVLLCIGIPVFLSSIILVGIHAPTSGRFTLLQQPPTVRVGQVSLSHTLLLLNVWLRSVTNVLLTFISLLDNTRHYYRRSCFDRPLTYLST